MATIKQGILGGLSGSVGSVTGSSWKGIAILKAKPLSVANPKTALQVAQRDRMSYLVALFTQILSTVIKPLNDRFASKMSGYNLVVQQSMGAFDVAGEVDDFSKLFITPSSKGEQLFTADDPSVGDADVSISWVSTAGVGTQLATDKAYAVVINETTGVACASAGLISRSVGSLDITVPDDFNTLGVHYSFYLAFRKLDGTVVYKQAYEQATGVV